MLNKKPFEIIFQTSLFLTYIVYIHMDCLLIFSYEILKLQIFFFNFSGLTLVNLCNLGPGSLPGSTLCRV